MHLAQSFVKKSTFFLNILLFIKNTINFLKIRMILDVFVIV